MQGSIVSVGNVRASIVPCLLSAFLLAACAGEPPETGAPVASPYLDRDNERIDDVRDLPAQGVAAPEIPVVTLPPPESGQPCRNVFFNTGPVKEALAGENAISAASSIINGLGDDELMALPLKTKLSLVAAYNGLRHDERFIDDLKRLYSFIPDDPVFHKWDKGRLEVLRHRLETDESLNVAAANWDSMTAEQRRYTALHAHRIYVDVYGAEFGMPYRNITQDMRGRDYPAIYFPSIKEIGMDAASMSFSVAMMFVFHESDHAVMDFYRNEYEAGRIPEGHVLHGQARMVSGTWQNYIETHVDNVAYGRNPIERRARFIGDFGEVYAGANASDANIAELARAHRRHWSYFQRIQDTCTAESGQPSANLAAVQPIQTKLEMKQ